MSSDPQANTGAGRAGGCRGSGYSACGGDLRSTIRALIVANDYLETEVGELMKAVSHAYVREISIPIRLSK